MKRVNFVALIALTLAVSAPIAAQQAQGRNSPVAGTSTERCHYGSESYSKGALIRNGGSGSIVMCEEGKWVPAPASATGQAPTTTVSGQQAPGRTATTAGQGNNSFAADDNIRLELMITDQAGAAQPLKKAVTLLIAERGMGRVRSGGQFLATAGNYMNVTLNADANVISVSGDRIRLHITVEYQPAAPEQVGSNPQRVTVLNQTVDVILVSGKPMLIVESADPMSDRKVSLTATATIVR